MDATVAAVVQERVPQIDSLLIARGGVRNHADVTVPSRTCVC